MTEEPKRETAKERVIRRRSDARKLIDQRSLIADESEEGLDEMIRRSIDLHGA